VTYVPDNIKAEIGHQVAGELQPKVVREVLSEARGQGWGVPGALPEWIKSLSIYGDVRMRAEDANYGSDNAQFSYLNFDAVNQAGGIGKTGTAALLNTTVDRSRLLGRLRLGLTANLGGAFSADLRLASGVGRNVGSTNQTLGAYGARGGVNVDKAALNWDHISPGITREFLVQTGRFDNPYVTTSELVWDKDLTFEGIAATYAVDLAHRNATRVDHNLFLTVGASPIQEIELSRHDKWLYGAQLGGELPFGESAMLRLSAAYFIFSNIAGVRNAPDSTLLDYTAPRYLQKGNTLFDIRNSTTDTTVNLFALAADYRLANVNFSLDLPFLARQRLLLSGEIVRNVGYSATRILARTGSHVAPRINGYDMALTIGSASLRAARAWRAGIGYRYLQRDAVLDAFTDSDFHLGGTDAKGYTATFDLGLSRNAWLRARLMSATEIDGPPLAIDVYQLDLTGSF